MHNLNHYVRLRSLR